MDNLPKMWESLTISVDSISTNSGVYISQSNVIMGMSSHSKSNNGLGTVDSNNVISQNANILIDNDVIDTVIDDRDVKIYQEVRPTDAAHVTQVGFDTIHVNTMSQNAGVFVGDVKITGLDAHSKQNSAKGSVGGDKNIEMHNLNFVSDTDVIDTPIYDQDIKILSNS